MYLCLKFLSFVVGFFAAVSFVMHHSLSVVMLTKAGKKGSLHSGP